jgi:hypothetical protein
VVVDFLGDEVVPEEDPKDDLSEEVETSEEVEPSEEVKPSEEVEEEGTGSEE